MGVAQRLRIINKNVKVRTIWKYELEIDDGPIMVICRREAVVLKWGADPSNGLISNEISSRRKIWFWAMVDTEKEEEVRYFNIYGTGHKLRTSSAKQQVVGWYKDTVTDGQFYWHIFQIDVDTAKEQELGKTDRRKK